MKPIVNLHVAALLWLAASGANAETLNRPYLAGTVVSENGLPITNATVFIYTAGPKIGAGVICPSCYADCAKCAKSDSIGSFQIAELDPELIFRLLVAAPGFETLFVNKVDPTNGTPTIPLKAISAEKLKTSRRIAGVVFGPNGKPLAGATISPEGVETGESTRWGGISESVDPIVITDERGRFSMFCKSNVTLVHSVAAGPNAAQRWVALKPGDDHLVRLSSGVFVSGRILHNGKPVAGAVVGATTVERTCGAYLNCDSVATDENGRFGLANVPRDLEFVAFVKMNSLNGLGSVEAKPFATQAAQETLDLGTMEVKPGYRVAGRIVLSDGESIPPNTRLMLGVDSVIDTQEVILPPTGEFEFKEIPGTSVGLHVRLKGYMFSKKNPSLDWLNDGIVGRVSGDISNLNLLMEPGQWNFDDRDSAPAGADSQPKGQPLRGVKL